MPGATPNWGFPYPLLGEPPHGPDQIEDLASAIDAVLLHGVKIVASEADLPAITPVATGRLAYVTAAQSLFRYTGSTWVPDRVYAHAYQAAVGGQSVPNLTPTAITMTGQEAIVGGGHSTSVNPSRYAPTIPGRYRCRGMVVFAAEAFQFSAQFRKNGAVPSGGAAPYGSTQGFASSFVAMSARAEATFSMNGSTDYIELYTAHNRGSTVDTFSNSTDQHSYWIIERMGTT